MSGFEIEDIKAVAKGMGEEEVKVFLTQVNRKLLEAELSRRADETEKALAYITQMVNANV